MTLVLITLLVLGITGPALAGCGQVQQPSEVCELEQVKDATAEGNHDVAFRNLPSADQKKSVLLNQISQILTKEGTERINIRSNRQNESFIAERVLFRNEKSKIRVSVSGFTNGMTFQMEHFRFTTDFDKIRGYLY